MKVYFVWNGIKSLYSVRRNVLFTTISRLYREKLGVDSATFVFNGRQIPNDSITIGSLSPLEEIHIQVSNIVETDISTRSKIEVHIFNQSGSMGVRGYALKAGTPCSSLLRVLYSIMGTKNISIWYEGRMIAPDEVIADKPTLIAIVI